MPNWSVPLITALALAAALDAPLLRAQAAAPDLAREGSFLVFFDWGKPELRDEAKATLDRAAQSFLASPGARLRIEAHSDRSGSAAVNQRAALHRARQVRGYLVAKGVPMARISLRSFGESRPLIQTADGVREVQNRRVEVVVEPLSGR